ncbi:unnamed protein product [Lathyrus oleraceus]
MMRGIILLVALFILFNQSYGQKTCQFGVELTYDCSKDISICPTEVAKKYGIKPISCVCQYNPTIIIKYCTCSAACPPPVKEKKILSL